MIFIEVLRRFNSGDDFATVLEESLEFVLVRLPRAASVGRIPLLGVGFMPNSHSAGAPNLRIPCPFGGLHDLAVGS